MELDLIIFGLHVHCTRLYSLAETPNPLHPPAFGLIYEGAIGQPRKTTSLCDPLLKPVNNNQLLKHVGSCIFIVVYDDKFMHYCILFWQLQQIALIGCMVLALSAMHCSRLERLATESG